MRATIPTNPDAAHDAIRYDCERCKREFVLGPQRRRLSPIGWLGAVAATVGGGGHGSRGSRFSAVRRDALTRANEHATEAFIASFRFCHECRRFVCPRCWSRSWKTCRACVVRAMNKMPVARRRFRFGTSLIVIGAALALLVLGVGEVLAVTNSGPSPRPAATSHATPSPAATPTAVSMGPTLVIG